MPGLSQSISAESCSISEYYDAVEENNLDMIESGSESSSEVCSPYPDVKVIWLFSCSIQLSMIFKLLITTEMVQIKLKMQV